MRYKRKKLWLGVLMTFHHTVIYIATDLHVDYFDRDYCLVQSRLLLMDMSSATWSVSAEVDMRGRSGEGQIPDYSAPENRCIVVQQLVI